MKRAHRRWHARMGWLLAPVLLVLLSGVALVRTAPVYNAALPAALSGAPSKESR